MFIPLVLFVFILLLVLYIKLQLEGLKRYWIVPMEITLRNLLPPVTESLTLSPEPQQEPEQPQQLSRPETKPKPFEPHTETQQPETKQPKTIQKSQSQQSKLTLADSKLESLPEEHQPETTSQLRSTKPKLPKPTLELVKIEPDSKLNQPEPEKPPPTPQQAETTCSTPESEIKAPGSALPKAPELETETQTTPGPEITQSDTVERTGFRFSVDPKSYFDPIDKIPGEIWKTILGYGNNMDASSLLFTSKTCHNAFWDHIQNLDCDGSCMWILNQCKGHLLKKVKVCAENEPFLEIIQALSRMQILRLALTDTDLLALHATKSLYCFDLSMSLITDEGLSIVASMKHLELSKLNLLGCEEITDAGMVCVGKISSLTSLNLYGNIRITDTGISHLSALANLKSLNLNAVSNLTKESLNCVQKLSSLRKLNLGHTLNCTGSEFQQLPASLRHLNLRCSGLSAENCEHLTHLTCLKKLDVSLCSSLAASGIHSLAKLTTLVRLNMDGCSSASGGIYALAELTNLRTLDISSCKVGDDTISHLTTLVNLSKLILGDNPITDISIKHIQVLTRLKTLKLAYCTGLVGLYSIWPDLTFQGRGLSFMTSLVHLDLGYTAIPRSLACAIRSKLKYLEKLEGYPDVIHEEHIGQSRPHKFTLSSSEDQLEPENLNTATTIADQEQYIQELQHEIDKRIEAIAATQAEINRVNSELHEMEQQKHKDGEIYTALYTCYMQLSDLRKKKESIELEKFQLQHVQKTEHKRLTELQNASYAC